MQIYEIPKQLHKLLGGNQATEIINGMKLLKYGMYILYYSLINQ